MLTTTFLASLIDGAQLNTWRDIMEECVNMLLHLLDLFRTCQGNVFVPSGNSLANEYLRLSRFMVGALSLHEKLGRESEHRGLLDSQQVT